MATWMSAMEVEVDPFALPVVDEDDDDEVQIAEGAAAPLPPRPLPPMSSRDIIDLQPDTEALAAEILAEFTRDFRDRHVMPSFIIERWLTTAVRGATDLARAFMDTGGVYAGRVRTYRMHLAGEAGELMSGTRGRGRAQGRGRQERLA